MWHLHLFLPRAPAAAAEIPPWQAGAWQAAPRRQTAQRGRQAVLNQQTKDRGLTAGEPAQQAKPAAKPRLPVNPFSNLSTDTPDDQLLLVTSSPHLHSGDTTRRLMGEVLIALTPAALMAVFLFGYRAAAHILLAVCSCMGFEALYCHLRKWPVTVFDLSAAITGVLLAFNLPVAAPLWMPVVGSFFAIFIVKMLFGGLGKNFVNPALVGRVFLANSWAGDMVSWTRPVLNPFTWTTVTADALTGATPLGLLKSGALPEAYGHGGQLWNMLIGARGGCLGETCALLLVAGGLYLMVRGVISWHIPAGYIGTVALFSLLFPVGGASPLLSVFYSLNGGGLMLGAFFMATDDVTSPLSDRARLFYGIGCGLLTVFIRRFGPAAEGVSFSILIMNLVVWFLDRATLPRRFGEEASK
ncbi:MAG: RnfABCDGE type electron transport complex subunit D [Clostridia bacterium]|nr:RnfABCDGE type electron transport complex subunit D [Clostridia bacterium]